MTQQTKPKEEKTAKERLVLAGLDVFSRYGYEGASTRELTAHAQVNISAIPYYFGDKKGLYMAVLAEIIDRAKAELSDGVKNLHSLLDEESLPRQVYCEMLDEMIRVFTAFLLGDQTTMQMSHIFLREQMDPTPGFDIIYEQLLKDTHDVLARLIERITGMPRTDLQTILCAHAIIGQVSVFKTHQEAIHRGTGWAAYNQQERSQISQMIQKHTRAILDMYTKQTAKG